MFQWVLFIYLLTTSVCLKASTIKTIMHGNWENPANWSNNQVPTTPDTILVLHYMVINQNLIINSPAVLYIEFSGTVCGDYMMETMCGASFINYGHMYLNQIKTRLGSNYNIIQCKNSITLLGCSSGGSYFNSIPPNGHVEVWPPVFCKTPATNWEGGPTGIKEMENSQLLVFPNPVGNEWLHVTTIGVGKFRLTDMMNKEITSQSFENDILFNMSGVICGIYFLEMEINGKKETKKIFKIN